MIEENIKCESSYEYFDSNHMNHENGVLRKHYNEIIKAKDEEIKKLKYELEVYKSINAVRVPPYGN